MSAPEFHRDNHYVPALYLRGFTNERGRLFNYRTLVSRCDIPTWKATSPTGVGYLAHLYTRVLSGNETDEFEKWLDCDFESPAADPLTKAIADQPLTPGEWRMLARFAAAQIVRTPAFFIRQLPRWRKELPALLESVLTDMLEDTRLRKGRGETTPVIPVPSDNLLPVKVTVKPASDPTMREVSASTITGRDMWLFSMRDLLTNTVQRLEEQRWTILMPAGDLDWFTSDDPVVCLNSYRDGSYDFGGGWGRPGSEIFTPLGPKHLLYTIVGARPPRRGTVLDNVRTQVMRKFIAEHAYRFIFSKIPDGVVPNLRPRRVDATAFDAEARFWKNWHAEQTALLELLRQ